MSVETVMVILSEASARFYWYERPADAPAENSMQTGLQVMVKGHVGDDWVWTVAHRELLELYRERIADYVRSVVYARQPSPVPGKLYQVGYRLYAVDAAP